MAEPTSCGACEFCGRHTSHHEACPNFEAARRELALQAIGQQLVREAEFLAYDPEDPRGEYYD